MSIFYKTLLTASILFSPANSEASWTAPIQISTSSSDQPNIAVDLLGNAVAVWQGNDCSNYIIQSASLPFRGNWSYPVNLSKIGYDAECPQVAINAFGNAVSIWRLINTSSSVIQAAKLPFKGFWSNVSDISNASGNSESHSLSIDRSGTVGNAVAVWTRHNGIHFIVQSSILPESGDWSIPTNISPSGQDALVPDISVDPKGNALTVFAKFDGKNFTSRSALLLKSGEWGPNYVISNTAQSANQASVSLDQNGNAIILWTEFDGSHYIVQSSTIPYGGTFSLPVSISNPCKSSYIPKIASNPIGNAIALWVLFDGVNLIAETAFLMSENNWSKPIKLSNSGKNVANISIKANSSGNAVAVWDETDGVNSVIYSATYAFDTKTWSTSEAISTTGNFAYLPVVDIDSEGNAVAIWLQAVGTMFYVFGSTLL